MRIRWSANRLYGFGIIPVLHIAIICRIVIGYFSHFRPRPIINPIFNQVLVAAHKEIGIYARSNPSAFIGYNLRIIDRYLVFIGMSYRSIVECIAITGYIQEGVPLWSSVTHGCVGSSFSFSSPEYQSPHVVPTLYS